MNNVMEVVVRTVNFIRSRGLNHRQFDSLLREKDHNYGLPYHTEVRWLSQGAVLRRFFDLRGEIKQFMEKKGKPVLEFKSTEWMQDLPFMVDVTEHLNNLNKMLQGRSKVVTQYYDSICAFKLKLSLWETQLADLKGKFAAAGLDTFYQHLLPGYPNLTALAAKVLCMFGTTYLCEQVFSVMNINKTKLRSRLTHKHLNDILKLAATQDVMPNIDALVKEFSANLKCFVKNIICDVFRMYQSKTKETHLKLSLFLSYTMILPVRPTWE
ncbi:general transcription factor II-I repeat domain-containing protein 2B-like [Penaeus monodon]|uniref:general transcription factor II-I repeat domain-containing protein 2B-like n=1 Tax=Penaeus monodon TaxID=6687 RepID=UPI0018A73008|nr:general transcription factor II-I repeat domain-containing protein 2B-like [Penaeus monodon]